MKLQPVLKAALMLGLVIAGRYARDAEQTNPGQSLNEIMRHSTAAAPVAEPKARPHAVLPAGLTQSLPAVTRPQTASFTEVN